MTTTAFFHGVTVTEVDVGPRVITLPSSSVIGLVDTYTPGTGLVSADKPTLITSLRDAVNAFGATAPITQSCAAIFQQAQAIIVAVGSAVVTGGGSQTSEIIGTETGSTRTGLQALLDAKSLLDQKPRLLIAPGWSSTEAVATAMGVLANQLRAIAIIDGPNSTDTAATAYAALFGDKRFFLVDPEVIYYNATSNAYVTTPSSPYVAGMFAQMDASVGFWASPSNQLIQGITGTSRNVEFNDGDPSCRANVLNNAFITTIIRDGGFRLWGNRTLDNSGLFTFVTRVRTFDMVMDALLLGNKWAVDKGITKTYVTDVTEGLRAFMADLRNLGAVIDFDAFPDPQLNTITSLATGKIYWDIRFTDVPPAENPIFRVSVVNDWLTEVLSTPN